MANDFNFLIGKKIELEIISSTGNILGQSYVSQVVDCGDDYIELVAPIHQNKLKLLLKGTRVRLFHIQESVGVNSIQGIVDSTKNDNQNFTFVVIVEKEMKKIQRRQFFRLPCSLNGKITNLENQKSYNIKLIDISGNGCSFVSNELFDTNIKYELEVSIDDLKIKSNGQIIRINKTKVNNMYGFKFENIQKSDQEKIIKYIFSQQRKMKK